MISTTIAIIAKDEASTIARVVEQARPLAGELLVIDGGSADGTAQIAARAGAVVIADSGRGKGAGVRLAIARAAGEVLVLMDADGSHQPADIPRLAAPILQGQADLVIASRLRGGSDEFHGTLDNIIRQAGGALISLMLNWRWKADITDCENGFRAVKVSRARELDLRADDFLIEQEMVIKALKRGLRIAEVASHEYSRQGGASKLKTSQGWRFLWHIFREMLF